VGTHVEGFSRGVQKEKAACRVLQKEEKRQKREKTLCLKGIFYCGGGGGSKRGRGWTAKQGPRRRRMIMSTCSPDEGKTWKIVGIRLGKRAGEGQIPIRNEETRTKGGWKGKSITRNFGGGHDNLLPCFALERPPGLQMGGGAKATAVHVK